MVISTSSFFPSKHGELGGFSPQKSLAEVAAPLFFVTKWRNIPHKKKRWSQGHGIIQRETPWNVIMGTHWF
jgi:hypothetical protein